MSFISKAKILEKFEDQFNDNNFSENNFSKSGASYDLRLGEEALVTPDKIPKRLAKGEILNIEPGQFAVLMTEEYLKMPNDILGFITVRFRYKSKGLVNISGFHVDPGFEGHLVFSVYNTGPSAVTLRRGEKVFSIFFAEINPPVKYDGNYVGQKTLPLDILETLAGARIPSLQNLERKVIRNWTTIKLYGTILTGLTIGILGVLIKQLL